MSTISENATDSEDSQPIVAEYSDNGIVAIYVGPERMRFILEKQFLIARCDYFAMMLRSEFRCSEQSVLNLPNDDSEVFGKFITYLRHGTIPKIFEQPTIWPPGPTPEDLGRYKVYATLMRKLYYFAEKLGMESLSNKVLDKYRAHQYRMKLRMSVDVVKEVYQNTSEGSGLRAYAAASIASTILSTPQEFAAQRIVGIARLSEKCPEFTVDLLRAQVKHAAHFQKPGADYRNPTARSGFTACEFHVHCPGSKCH